MNLLRADTKFPNTAYMRGKTSEEKQNWIIQKLKLVLVILQWIQLSRKKHY